MADAKMLRDARRQKKDEFYTQLSDIENELRHYKSHFNAMTHGSPTSFSTSR